MRGWRASLPTGRLTTIAAPFSPSPVLPPFPLSPLTQYLPSHARARPPEPHDPLTPTYSAQIDSSPRQADQHARLQAARERDRDVDGLRGHQGPSHPAGRNRDPARANDWAPGL